MVLCLVARKSISKSVEATVLLKSRRRCCICFGLDRDTLLKSGQIAHLDKNRDNNTESNLAFLCFHHHDEYDSISYQRKNFTIEEVKEFRKELYILIDIGLSQKVHFGEITIPPSDPYAGTWMRVGTGSDNAEITLTPLPDSWEHAVQYFVMGMALWGGERPQGPNIGTIEFVGTMSNDLSIIYERYVSNNKFVSTRLYFDGYGGLKVN